MFPSLQAIIHIGSTKNFEGGHVNDIDIIMINSGDRNIRKKLSISQRNFLFDITYFQSYDFKNHLVSEAIRGHYDIAQGISTGNLIYISDADWGKYLKTSIEILENGQEKYINTDRVSTYRVSLTKILNSIKNKSSRNNFFLVMASYNIIYEAFMLSKGYWRCVGAYRQIADLEEGVILRDAFLNMASGKSSDMIGLIESSLDKLGGPLFDFVY